MSETIGHLTSNRRLGDLAPRLIRTSLIIGLLLIGISILLALGTGGERFFRSYLTAFMFVLSIALGGLFFVVLQYLAKAGWSVTIRRIGEGFAGALTGIWVLFLPIIVLVMIGKGEWLYDWMAAEHHGEHTEILEHKKPYLNIPFWLIRAVIFFGIWAVAGAFLLRNSVRQDRTGDVGITLHVQWWAPILMILYAISQTFSVIDWVMTREALWFSTMFGVYFFAASCCGFFAAQILTIYFLQRWGRMTGEVTVEHYQDMGKQLFAFGIVFWTYIAFSQYMLIWYANIPEETVWYLGRQLGPWAGVSIALLVGHFVLPFVLLVTRHTKRVKPVLALIAAGMLVMHFVDMYWLVMPRVPHEVIAESESYAEAEAAVRADPEETVAWSPHLLDLTLVVGMGALLVGLVGWRLRDCSLVPEQDPRLPEALAFENM